MPLSWEEPRVWVVHPQGRTAPDPAPHRPLSPGTAKALVRRPAVERRLDDDRVLIDIIGKATYVLNPTAWAGWELCDGQRTADQVVSELARRYRVDEATVAPGFVRVLAVLEAAELVVEVDR
jgi:coenzyme PQQ synthesis protein D (PqqD)